MGPVVGVPYPEKFLTPEFVLISKKWGSLANGVVNYINNPYARSSETNALFIQKRRGEMLSQFGDLMKRSPMNKIRYPYFNPLMDIVFRTRTEPMDNIHEKITAVAKSSGERDSYYRSIYGSMPILIAAIMHETPQAYIFVYKALVLKNSYLNRLLTAMVVIIFMEYTADERAKTWPEFLEICERICVLTQMFKNYTDLSEISDKYAHLCLSVCMVSPAQFPDMVIKTPEFVAEEYVSVKKQMDRVISVLPMEQSTYPLQLVCKNKIQDKGGHIYIWDWLSMIQSFYPHTRETEEHCFLPGEDTQVATAGPVLTKQDISKLREMSDEELYFISCEIEENTGMNEEEEEEEKGERGKESLSNLVYEISRTSTNGGWMDVRPEEVCMSPTPTPRIPNWASIGLYTP